MQLFVRLILAAVLAWQAAAAVQQLCRQTADLARFDYRQRLFADTEARVHEAIGDDFALYEALRRLPTGAWVVTQKAQGSIEDLERLSTLHARVLQLTQLLYPSPLLFGLPEPIGLCEARSRPDMKVWLLVLGGERAPDGRPGWTCEHSSERFQLWRFQKA